MFKLGLIINPMAGIGGPLALKGSDDVDTAQRQVDVELHGRANQRAYRALAAAADITELTVYCFDSAMGAATARALGMSVQVIGCAAADLSTAGDTKAAAQKLAEQGVDLLLFVGGDGTARDICEVITDRQPVLGVPAGVKMHSGVYAVSPEAAGALLQRMVAGQLVDVGLGEVRDIDEQAYRQGQVRSRFYGELLVPREGHFLQQVKSSGREVEELVIQDIALDIVESMDDQILYLIGAGTTPSGIMVELGLDNTLLGVDAVCARQLLGSDLSESELLALLTAHSGPAKIIVTAIGGQGHIFGRGNQQFSPEVIRRVGLGNIIIIASKTKITELRGRPLLVDSNDADMDCSFAGYRQIITGYHDAILYPVGLVTAESSQ